MELREFPHIILINQSKIKIKALDTGIQALVDDFVKSYKGYQLKKSEKQLEVLKAKSEVLATHIYTFFVDEDDQTENPTLAEQVEAIKEEVEEKPELEATIAEQTEFVNEVVRTEAEVANLHTFTPSEDKGTIEVPKAFEVDGKTELIVDKDLAVEAGIDSKDIKPATKIEKKTDNDIIREMFEAGKTEVSIDELKEAGFNTGWFGPLDSMGANLAGFKLKASAMFGKVYRIIKK